MAASNFLQVVEKYNPYHGKDGRFTSGGSASATVPMGAKSSRIAALSAKTTAETSGSTISTKNGYVPKAGFMVAVDTDRSKVIHVDLDDPDVEKKLAGEIKKYMTDNKDLLGQKGKYLGTWQDSATGDLYLDVSTHVKNKAEAVALGRKHNQIAIWDVKHGQEINTGGTGEHVEKGFEIMKSDSDKQYVFGWANVAIRKDGEQISDYQGDMIDPEELESAAYEHVLKFRSAGERHDPNFRNKGRLIESVVFTKEKLDAMGIPEGTVPLGWWVGYHIEDAEAWEKIKKGEYRMFSIEGQAQREPVEKSKGIAKLFKDLVAKFNPYHDKLGRFASAGSGNIAFTTIATKDPNKQHWADNAKEKAKYNLKNKVPVKVVTATNEFGTHEYHVMQDGTTYNKYGIKLKHNDAESLVRYLQDNGYETSMANYKGDKQYKPPKVKGNKEGAGKKIDDSNESLKYAEEDYKRYEFTSAQNKAITDYTGSSYKPMNKYLRNGVETDDHNKAKIKNLTEAIDETSTQEAIVTYRGLGNSAYQSFLQQGGVKSADSLIGATITDKGFVSTSFLKTTADSFSGSNVVMEISVPKGAKALMPNGKSQFDGEAEVILQRGAKFKITGTRTGNSQTGEQVTYLVCDYVSP